MSAMKNYLKPTVYVEKISGINEQIFLYGSADWNKTNCYNAVLIPKQAMPEDGRFDFRFQVNGKHDAQDGHDCTKQYMIIKFTNEIPEGVTASLSGGANLEFGFNPDDRHYARVTTNYFNNDTDFIGLGDFIISLTDENGLLVEDPDYYFPSHIYLYDDVPGWRVYS